MTAMPTYSTGTVSIGAAATTVAGVGTIWSGVNARPGDTLVVDGHEVTIMDVTDVDELVIEEWPFTAVPALTTYKIIHDSPFRFAGAQAMADVSTLVAALNTTGYFVFVAAGETEPDPSLGEEDQFAYKPGTGQLWLKTGGVWVEQDYAIGGGFVLSGVLTPAQITSSQNDYNPTDFDHSAVIRLSSDASWNITGMGAGEDGEVKLIHNVGSNTITLKNADSGSSAANRFALTGDIQLTANGFSIIQYDATSSRWRALSGGGAFADGTVGAPSITFANDNDNGFYRIGANNWAASVGGSKLLDFAAGALALIGVLSIAPSAALSNGQSALSITATQPTTPVAAQNAISFQITGAGSASQSNRAVVIDYLAGYTGSSQTAALRSINASAGTGSVPVPASNTSTVVGNIGVLAGATGTTTGLNVGFSSSVSGGDTNVGNAAIAQVAKTGAGTKTNIGLLASAYNAVTGGSTPVQIGAFVSLNQTTLPTVSAALIADNGSQTDAIMLGRDNGTTVFGIYDGGVTVVGSAAVSMYGGGGNSQTFQINGISTATAGMGFSRFSNDINPPRFFFAKSRGTTVGTPGLVSANDELGSIYFQGDNGTSFNSAAAIRAFASGTPSSTSMGGRLQFYTQADGGISTIAISTLRMTIFDDGGVVIGSTTTSPGAGVLSVVGQIIGSSVVNTFGPGGNVNTNTSYIRLNGSSAATQPAVVEFQTNSTSRWQMGMQVGGTLDFAWYRAGSSIFAFRISNSDDSVSFNSTTASSSTTTGALVVGGGAGFAGDVFAPTFNCKGSNAGLAVDDRTNGSSHGWVWYAQGNSMFFFSSSGSANRLSISDSTGFTNIGPGTADALLTVNGNTGATVAPPSGVVSHFVGADAASAYFVADGYGGSFSFYGRRANNTRASPTGVVSGNNLMQFIGQGYTSAGAYTLVASPAVSMRFQAAETFSGTAQGSRIIFTTTPLTTIVPADAVQIEPSGALLCLIPTGGLGYGTGAGGTVTQATSKSTGVTLNKVTGKITMNNAALAAATIVSFTVTCSAVAATDKIDVSHESGGTTGAYTINARATGAGTFAIDVRNNTAGSLGEALVLRYAIIKSVDA